MNRDGKKNRKPFSALDFCFFHDVEANRPQARAAAAYMRLIADKAMPPWALFCFTDFKHAEASAKDLSEVAIMGGDWILLDPVVLDGGFQGLLLAEHSASGQLRTGSFQEREVTVRLPSFEDFVLAREGVELDEITQPGPVPPSA